VGIRVRLEGNESRRGVGMSFLTGMQPVVWMHRGPRVIDALDAMESMAIETLRRVSVAQHVYLAVIGVGVSLEAICMAGTAGSNDCKPGCV
jgi:hypothetical protein